MGVEKAKHLIMNYNSKRGGTMPSRLDELDLLIKLEKLVKGHPSGLTVVQTIEGGIVLERRGHARGVWRCLKNQFAWTPAGYGEHTHLADDVAAAVAYSRAHLLG
jgi:hypothetical protein